MNFWKFGEDLFVRIFGEEKRENNYLKKKEKKKKEAEKGVYLFIFGIITF